MATVPLVQIPAPPSVGGRPRRQPLYDTEVIKGSTTIPNEFMLFNNFAQFRVAPEDTNIGQAKDTGGRDTNLSGGGTSGLPHGFAFYAYSMRLKYLTYGINLTSAGNIAISDELRRIRELCSVVVKLQAVEYIVVPSHEIPSGPGPTTHHSNVSAAVSWGLAWGVPHRNNVYDLTISNKPLGLETGQQFRLLHRCATGAGLTPDIDYFVQAHLLGIAAIATA